MRTLKTNLALSIRSYRSCAFWTGDAKLADTAMDSTVADNALRIDGSDGYAKKCQSSRLSCNDHILRISMVQPRSKCRCNVTVMQHSAMEANGVRLHYACTGKGLPIALLHGWPEFWFTWEPVTRASANRFDLIAPDLPGFGDSPKPDDGPSIGPGPRYTRRTCWRCSTIWVSTESGL